MTPALYRFAAEALAAALILGGIFALGHHGGYKAGAAAVQVKLDNERIQHRDALIKAQADAAAETSRRLTAGQEQDHADLKTAQERVDAAVAAADAAERLRRRTVAIAAACARASNPAAAGFSQAASSPGDLLADVQQRLVSAARQLAEHADASRDAAESCAARYDALTAPPK